MKKEIQFTACQAKAMQGIEQWFKGREQILVIGGYAGTGKSTIAKYFEKQLGIDALYCAYTGKAAFALRERGASNASTIHGLIYKFFEPKEAREFLFEARSTMQSCVAGSRRYRAWEKTYGQLHNIIKTGGDGAFVLNPLSPICGSDLVVVDEYSMVNADIVDDLTMLADKILFLGDPAQLPPVEGKTPLKPQYFLDEVVRQALDNPVLRAATLIREGKPIPAGADWGKFKRIKKKDFEWDLANSVDQILCGKNITRTALNKKFRDRLGLTDNLPMTDDKLVCLKNNHNIGLYNGVTGICVNPREVGGEFLIDLQQKGRFFEELSVWGARFTEGRQPERWETRAYDHFDFGYALTVHKAQGSEWNNIAIFAEMRNPAWLYTAITRAKKTAIWID
ncbi:MAG: ATP-dependent DNA helicase [Candidatus Binatia bacterium]